MWKNAAEGKQDTRAQEGKTKTADRQEEIERRNERLLITWLSDEPEIFAQVSEYLRPEHFREGIYRQAAEGCWRILTENKGGNPAAVIGMFDTQDEQEAAASLFNTRLQGLNTKAEREKALKDIVISIRKSAADREKEQIGMNGQDSAEMMKKMIQTKRDLEALHGIRFNLSDAQQPL